MGFMRSARTAISDARPTDAGGGRSTLLEAAKPAISRTGRRPETITSALRFSEADCRNEYECGGRDHHFFQQFLLFSFAEVAGIEKR